MALFKKNYSVQDETWQTQEQFRDRHLLRLINADLGNSGRVTVRAPEMKGGTTVAFLPYPDFTNGGTPTKVLPDRWDSDPTHPRSYNRWLFIASDKGVLRFGRQWISVLFDNPEDSGWDFFSDHPIQLIHRHTSTAVKKNHDVQTPYGSASSDNWKLLVEGDGKGEFEIIKRPEVMFLAFAVVYNSGPHDYLKETGTAYGASSSDPLVVFVMSRATGATFMDEIDKPKVNGDYSQGLLHPTITGSKFVHFYDKKLPGCPMLRTAAAPAGGEEFGGRRTPASRLGEQAPTGFGYGVALSDTIDGLPGSRDLKRDAISKYVLNRVMPWEKVLRGHTPDECADLVQSMAGLPLSVLAHAWQSHPEYFNETTRSMMAAKVTFAPTPTKPGPVVGAAGRRSDMDDPVVDDAVDNDPGASPFSGQPAAAPAAPSTFTGPAAADTANTLYDKNRLEEARQRLQEALKGSSLPPPPTFRKPNN